MQQLAALAQDLRVSGQAWRHDRFGWRLLFPKAGYGLEVSADLKAVTCYLAADNDRSWAQVKLGTPSRPPESSPRDPSPTGTPVLDPATVKITQGALEQYIRVFHGIRYVNPEAAPTYELDMRRALERILRYWNDGYGHDAPLPGPDHTLWLVSANRRARHGRVTAVWRRKP